MDAPPIRYAETSDGLQIAYWTLGTGPTLLWLGDLGFSHTARVWERHELREHFEALAERFQVVYLDPRNHGLSTRGSMQLSLDDQARDLDAVVDAIGARELALYAQGDRAKLAVQYALLRPDDVTSVTLAHPVLGTVPEQPGHREIAIVYPLVKVDWKMYTDVASTIYTGLDDPALTAWSAEFMRASVDLDDYRHTIAATTKADVTERFLEVRAPILVVVAENLWLGMEEPLRVASRAAGVEVVHVSADSVYAALAPTAEAIIDRFGAAPTEATEPNGIPDRALQTILFTDLEASTPLTQRLGDEGAQEILRGHNASVRGALEEHGGREVKHTGDGIMASFPSAVAAVTAALQIQRELAGGEVRVRVGLNAGEPIAEDDDLFGLSVIKAARVADRAEPGQVLVSRVVMDLCEGKTFEFSSLGAVSLKGFDEAVELFEVAG